jgi:transcription-repair coupling factor (superfamily II helicase)
MQVELIDRFGLLPETAKNHMRLAALKLDATSLGIDKIDVADNGGYLVFSKQTKIDPLALVKLVEAEGNVYRLTGAHRLKFRLDLASYNRRFKHVEKLLVMLSTNDIQSLEQVC